MDLVRAGEIDVIVIYKIDRLTSSPRDFYKKRHYRQRKFLY